MPSLAPMVVHFCHFLELKIILCSDSSFVCWRDMWFNPLPTSGTQAMPSKTTLTDSKSMLALFYPPPREFGHDKSILLSSLPNWESQSNPFWRPRYNCDYFVGLCSVSAWLASASQAYPTFSRQSTHHVSVMRDLSGGACPCHAWPPHRVVTKFWPNCNRLVGSDRVVTNFWPNCKL